jgi:hypothetical protein
MRVKNDIWLKNLVFASLRRLTDEKIREPQNFDIFKRTLVRYSMGDTRLAGLERMMGAPAEKYQREQGLQMGGVTQ